ncbi:sulfite exporter TauE/SafE family protein [Hydrogenobaculum acidophilum]
MTSYILIFVSGFLSFIHCYGMCGVFPASVSKLSDENNIKNAIYLFLYNLGRVLSYVFLGFLVSFGSMKFGALVNNIKYISDIFSITIGVLMAFVGIKLIFGKAIGSVSFLNPLYEGIIYIINILSSTKSIFSPFLIGVFNGLLPCPMVYGFLLLAALSKSPIQGILIMLSFGMGTMITMFSFGFMSKYITRLKHQAMYKLIGLILIYFSYESIARVYMSIYNCR